MAFRIWINVCFFWLALAAAASAPHAQDGKADVEINLQALDILRDRQSREAAPSPPAKVFMPSAPQNRVSLIFEGAGERLTDTSRSQFAQLTQDWRLRPARIELAAFAGGPGADRVQARRLALRRGVNLRARLMAQGIPAHMIRLIVPGLAEPDTPPHRIDLFLAID